MGALHKNRKRQRRVVGTQGTGILIEEGLDRKDQGWGSNRSGGFSVCTKLLLFVILLLVILSGLQFYQIIQLKNDIANQEIEIEAEIKNSEDCRSELDEVERHLRIRTENQGSSEAQVQEILNKNLPDKEMRDTPPTPTPVVNPSTEPMQQDDKKYEKEMEKILKKAERERRQATRRQEQDQMRRIQEEKEKAKQRQEQEQENLRVKQEQEIERL